MVRRRFIESTFHGTREGQGKGPFSAEKANVKEAGGLWQTVGRGR